MVFVVVFIILRGLLTRTPADAASERPAPGHPPLLLPHQVEHLRSKCAAPQLPLQHPPRPSPILLWRVYPSFLPSLQGSIGCRCACATSDIAPGQRPWHSPCTRISLSGHFHDLSSSPSVQRRHHTANRRRAWLCCAQPGGTRDPPCSERPSHNVGSQPLS